MSFAPDTPLCASHNINLFFLSRSCFEAYKRRGQSQFISWPFCGKMERSDIAKRTACKLSSFRVKAPVARRPPHRPGREDFPHPVPRSSIISDKQTSQATPRLAHNCCYSRYQILCTIRGLGSGNVSRKNSIDTSFL